MGDPTDEAEVGAGELAAEEGDEEEVVLLPLTLSPLSCKAEMEQMHIYDSYSFMRKFTLLGVLSFFPPNLFYILVYRT